MKTSKLKTSSDEGLAAVMKPLTTCPITGLVMADPVSTENGHTFEREAIEDWSSRNNTDPSTGTLLKNKDFIRSQQTINTRDAWFTQNPGNWHDPELIYLPKGWQREVVEEGLKQGKRDTISRYFGKHPGLLTLPYDAYNGETLMQLFCRYGDQQDLSWLQQRWESYKEGYMQTLLARTYNNQSLYSWGAANRLSIDKLNMLFSVDQRNKQVRETLLHYAARIGDSVLVEWGLESQDGDKDCQDGDGETALMIAARANKVDVVRSLLHYRVSLEEKNKKGRTAILLAIENGNTEIADALLTAGADINIWLNAQQGHWYKNLNIYLPWVWQSNVVNSIAKRDYQNLMYYLNKHPGLLFREYPAYKTSLLFLLTEKGDAKLLSGVIPLWERYQKGYSKRLFETAANAQEQNVCDWIVFCETEVESLNVIQKTIDDNQSNETILHRAARTGNKGLAVYWLKNEGGNPNATNNHGETALMLAVLSNHEEIISLLLEYKVNLEETLKNGRTALYQSILSKQFNIAEMLLNAGANPDVYCCDNDQWLIELAIQQECSTVLIDKLLEQGADTKARNRQQQTVIDVLEAKGNSQEASRLREYRRAQKSSLQKQLWKMNQHMQQQFSLQQSTIMQQKKMIEEQSAMLKAQQMEIAQLKSLTIELENNQVILALTKELYSWEYFSSKLQCGQFAKKVIWYQKDPIRLMYTNKLAKIEGSFSEHHHHLVALQDDKVAGYVVGSGGAISVSIFDINNLTDSKALKISHDGYRVPFPLQLTDGRLVTVSNLIAKVWNLHSGVCELSLDNTRSNSQRGAMNYNNGYYQNSISAIVQLQDNRMAIRLAIATGKTINIWNLNTALYEMTLTHVPQAMGKSAMSIRFEQDTPVAMIYASKSQRLVSADNQILCIWNPIKGICEKTINMSGRVDKMLELNDGCLAIFSLNKISVISLFSHTVETTFDLKYMSKGFFQLKNDYLAYHYLLSSSEDKSMHIDLLHLKSGECRTLKHQATSGNPCSNGIMQELRNGYLVSAYDNSIKLWNTDTRQCIKTIDAGPIRGFMSMIEIEGNRLVTASQKSYQNNHHIDIKVWEYSEYIDEIDLAFRQILQSRTHIQQQGLEATIEIIAEEGISHHEQTLSDCKDFLEKLVKVCDANNCKDYLFQINDKKLIIHAPNKDALTGLMNCLNSLVGGASKIKKNSYQVGEDRKTPNTNELVKDDEEPPEGRDWSAQPPGHSAAVEPFAEAASAAEAGRLRPSAAGGQDCAVTEDETETWTPRFVSRGPAHTRFFQKTPEDKRIENQHKTAPKKQKNKKNLQPINYEKAGPSRGGRYRKRGGK